MREDVRLIFIERHDKAKRDFVRFKGWCNANQGLLIFCAILVSILISLPFQSLKLTRANSFFDKVLLFLSSPIVLPLYLLAVVCIVLFFYFWRLRRRYKLQFITERFLIGSWKNEWLSEGRWHNEVLQITDDLRYLTAGEHWFNIADFRYDPQSRRLEFTKVSVKPNENRRLKNVLAVKNSDFLVGHEEDTEIKSSRI